MPFNLVRAGVYVATKVVIPSAGITTGYYNKYNNKYNDFPARGARINVSPKRATLDPLTRTMHHVHTTLFLSSLSFGSVPRLPQSC